MYCKFIYHSINSNLENVAAFQFGNIQTGSPANRQVLRVKIKNCNKYKTHKYNEHKSCTQCLYLNSALWE